MKKFRPMSVIMPVYKGEKTLHKPFTSLLAQDELPLELIIVDDKSPDASQQVVESFLSSNPPFKVQFIKSPVNKGPAAARNLAIQAAQGELLAFLDQDDQWEPTKIKKVWEIFSNLGPEYLGLTHNQFIEFADGRREPFQCGWPDSDLYSALLLRGNNIGTSCTTIRHSAIKEYGLFDENPALISVEDFDLWLRFAAHGKFYFLNEFLTVYDGSSGYSQYVPKAKRRLANLLIKHGLRPEKKISLRLRGEIILRAFRMRIRAQLMEWQTQLSQMKKLKV